MAEPDRDEKLSDAYRALSREEPPRAADEAILAAARREIETRPAPLVAPTGRRRWYVPVAAAAVIVLSVAVSWRMQREQPLDELTGAPPAPPARAPAAPAPRAQEEPPAPQAGRDVARSEAPAPAKLAAKAETPEEWLERIARLRREGRHKEADDAYAEFRRRHPDYVIPERLREEILPR